MTIDPQDLARFLVLDGSSELIDAFSRIPTGGIRQSVIQLAQELAGAYSAAPPSQTAPDPLLGLHRHVGVVHVNAPTSPMAKAIAGARGKGELKSKTPETRAVERRLRGETPKSISELEGVPHWKLTKLFGEARAAGVVFPVLRRMNVPIEEATKKSFPISEDDLTGQGRGAVEAAAKARGLDLDAYFARRRLFLELAQAKQPRHKIAEACREEPKVISGWYSNARACGLLPPWDEEFRAQRESVGA